MTAHEQWLPSASDQEDALARYDNDDRDPADDPRHLERAVELARTFPSLADNAILDAFDADHPVWEWAADEAEKAGRGDHP